MPSNDHLERVKDLQLAFKTPVLMDYAVRVVTVAAAHGSVWPDEVNTNDFRPEDKNCIGTVYRILKNAGILIHTVEFRKSTAEGRKGSTVFKYALASQSLAWTFLRRHLPEAAPKPGQQELSLT